MFVSIDRGARWVKMNNNMPNVAVHDLLVHPRENDLILGSYGRGLWVTNIGALQELTAPCWPKTRTCSRSSRRSQRMTWSFGANDYLFGQRHFSTPNEPNGMVIRYYLKNAGTARDRGHHRRGGAGSRPASGPATAGINTVVWNMRRDAGGAGGRGGGGGGGGGPPISISWRRSATTPSRVEVGATKLTGPANREDTGLGDRLTPQVIR